MRTSDFLVVGGGIIGINIARELKKRYADSKVSLIEKEDECGMHASGRNSGVLHAGFYYSSDSLKAKFTRLGNKMMTEYCESRNLKINKNGKLVVARDSDDLAPLDELFKRGKKNEIDIIEITEQEAKEIEPRVKTYRRALFSPTTSTVDPAEVVNSMKTEAIDEGVVIESGVSYVGKNGQGLLTSTGICSAGYVVNCAGLHADKIAQDFGFSDNYRILPFKGLYLYSDEPPGSFRTNVYPVPNLKNPFLGVHFTVTVDRRTKIGPTAIPALWREQYNMFDNFNAQECIDIVKREVGLFMSSKFEFKRLAVEEIRKYSRRHMVMLASELADGIKYSNFTRWGNPGIRAQLLDIKSKVLHMDFVLEGDDKSMHILNAVSPAFTCAIPFSQYVCSEIQSRIN